MNALKLKGRNIDTSSLDVLIILLRALASFDVQVEDTTPETSTEVELRLADAAQRDVGRNLDHDLQLKYEVLKAVLGTEVLTTDCMRGLTFSHFLLHFKFSRVFVHPFELYRNVCASRPADGENGTVVLRAIPSELLDKLNKLEPWNGTSSLQDYLNGTLFVEEVSHQGKIYYPYVARPPFLRIEYVLASRDNGHPFESIRTIKLEGETIWNEDGKTKHGCPSTLYVLFAIVRCAGGDKTDDIRTYWKTGREIVPIVQSLETNAIKEFKQSNKRWSIEEPGTFMLFYFRLEADSAVEAETQIRSTKGSEYEPRDWEQPAESTEQAAQPTHTGGPGPSKIPQPNAKNASKKQGSKKPGPSQHPLSAPRGSQGAPRARGRGGDSLRGKG
jgi:hypothetical protein